MAYKIDQAVGYNLKKQRLKQGLTQEALGRLAGMTKQGISNIEAGKGAASKTITTIADCLHISPFDLYKETEHEADTSFKRVTTPVIEYFNKLHYKEKISSIVDNLVLNIKNEIYYKVIVPVVKETFIQNRDMLLQRLETRCSVVNYNILEVYFEELLSNIRKSIYNEDNADEILEDNVYEIIEDNVQNNPAENKTIVYKHRKYTETEFREKIKEDMNHIQ